MKPMKIDMHFHVVGRGNDISQVDENVFFYPEDNNTLLTRVLYKTGGEGSWKSSGQTLTRVERSIQTSTSTWFTNFSATSKEIEGVVLLGLDALYDPESGKLDEVKTDLWVSNRFLSQEGKGIE